MRGLVPYPFGNFSGGLNLRDKADVVSDSEAIDLLNVEFTHVGAVQQRDGTVVHTSSALTNRVDSLSAFYKADGTAQILAGCGTRLEAVDASGGVVASATGLTNGPWTFCRFAAPGSEAAYAANGTDTVRKWTGSAWSAPANMPKAGAVCLNPSGTRLVATAFGTGATSGPSAAASNPSRVFFSDAGNPEAWTATNWIDLDPGDGEQILNCVRFAGQTFVFKESKFYVFTGESIDSTAHPTFQYRVVDAGAGLGAKLAIAVSRDGVFFMDRGGVYVTTGDAPRLLSDKISTVWGGVPEVYFQSGTLNYAQVALCRLAWHNERLYLSYPSGVATACDRVLVFDLPHGWWSLHDLPASALVSFRRSAQPELFLGYASGANEVARLSSGATDDAGTAITSRWRSGWGDYNSSVNKTIRESKIWGTDRATVLFSRDFERSAVQSADVQFGASSSDTWGDGTGSDLWGDGSDPEDLWGGAGQVSAALVRKAIRGTVFSTEFKNSSSATTWSVHRVARHLRESRHASVVRSGS